MGPPIKSMDINLVAAGMETIVYKSLVALSSPSNQPPKPELANLNSRY